MKLWNWSKGYKTYTVAALLVIYASIGYGTRHLTLDQAYLILLQAAGLAGLRHAQA